MVKRLEEKVAEMLSNQKCGFASGRSTQATGWYAKNQVRITDRTYVLDLGVCVDFKGAFDYLERSRVIEKWSEVGCEWAMAE